MAKEGGVMFVLTNAMKATQESTDPNMGVYWFVASLLIIGFWIYEDIGYRKWKKDLDDKFKSNKRKGR